MDPQAVNKPGKETNPQVDKHPKPDRPPTIQNIYQLGMPYKSGDPSNRLDPCSPDGPQSLRASLEYEPLFRHMTDDPSQTVRHYAQR